MLTDGGALILASTALEILSDRIDALGVEVMRDTTVATIDTERKVVVTEAGETVEYDKIILSCGPWTNQVGAHGRLSTTVNGCRLSATLLAGLRFHTQCCLPLRCRCWPRPGSRCCRRR